MIGVVDILGYHLREPLDPLHGDGYQFWSGIGGFSGVIYVLARKHNCYEHRCPRIGRVRGDDGHARCKRHHRRLHPAYGAAARG